MACCKYCSYPDENSQQEGTYLAISDFEREKKALRREMEHMKVNDLVAKELIRELQERLEQAQDRILELLYYLAQVRIPAHPTSSYYYPQDQKGPFCQTVNQKFMPWDVYHDYLVGDYEDETVDKTNKGYQSDEDIEGLVDVMPKEMQSDPHTIHKTHPRSWTATSSGPVSGVTSPRSGNWDHLATTEEQEIRTGDRIDTKLAFMSIGNESGSGESDFTELLEMVKNGTAEEKAYAEEVLRGIFSQGVKDKDDMSSDDEE